MFGQWDCSNDQVLHTHLLRQSSLHLWVIAPANIPSRLYTHLRNCLCNALVPLSKILVGYVLFHMLGPNKSTQVYSTELYKYQSRAQLSQVINNLITLGMCAHELVKLHNLFFILFCKCSAPHVCFIVTTRQLAYTLDSIIFIHCVVCKLFFTPVLQ